MLLEMVRIAMIAAAAGGGGGEPDRTCADRIEQGYIIIDGKTTVDRFAVDRRSDLVIGPVALRGFKDYRRPGTFEWIVREGMWFKSLAMISADTTVTLEVPPSQRRWLRLAYGHGEGAGKVTLKACRGELTAFGGGFDIDFERAPRQGRCAQLIVREQGRAKPLRRRLFSSAACR